MTTTQERLTRLERRQAATDRAIEELKARDAEREKDIEESEDRQMTALADLKADVMTRLDLLDAKMDSLSARVDLLLDHLQGQVAGLGLQIAASVVIVATQAGMEPKAVGEAIHETCTSQVAKALESGVDRSDQWKVGFKDALSFMVSDMLK